MENTKQRDWKKARQELHKLAELSGRENKTAAYIQDQLVYFEPDELITELGGRGIVAVFDSGAAGKSVMLRAELDALPIAEESGLIYNSRQPGISHKCGHDGHMAILLAVAEWLADNKSHYSGKVMLLFQPAEETAAGAKAILADKRFISLKPDHIFALHNLPGFKMGSLILREGAFAAASLGMKFRLKGKTSHAGHPENGNNPLFAMQNLINGLQNTPHRLTRMWEGSLITIIHIRLGEEAFGTSPGEGMVMATLRSGNNEILEKMAKEAERLAEQEAKLYGLLLEVERVEEFAATVNDKKAMGYLQKAAGVSGLQIIWQPEPFSWTEDFSYFCQKYSSAFFGLGSGINQPQLHNPDYDFPDELIEYGRKIFIKIIEEVGE